jgi:RNA polymerase sigma factor (sigma-70 family)
MLLPDDILARLKRDPRNADLWSALYELTEPRLRAFSYRLMRDYGGSPDEADDIVHEVLMRLLKNFSRIAAPMTSFQHLHNYLYKACRNEVRSQHRRSVVRLSAHEVLQLRFGDVVSDTLSQELQRSENRQFLDELLGRLKPACQDLMQEYLLSEQTLAEFAKERSLKLGSIYTQWQRCIQELRALIAPPL